MAASLKRDFQKKFKRRPILFWWQPFAALVIVALLFSNVPVSSIWRQTLTLAVPLSSPTAAYVTVDPDYAAQLSKHSLATWMTGQTQKPNRPGLDLGALDFDDKLGAPDFLEQGDVTQSSRPPMMLAALPVALAEIVIPPAAPAPKVVFPRKSQDGIFITASAALTAAAFTFPSEELKAMKTRLGESRFYVETDVEGNVAHVLLRSKPSPETMTVERALMRGRAQGAASGTLDIRWSLPK